MVARFRQKTSYGSSATMAGCAALATNFHMPVFATPNMDSKRSAEIWQPDYSKKLICRTLS